MYLSRNVKFLASNIKKPTWVAKELKISPNTMSLIINKPDYDPHLSILIKLSEYFGVSLDDLIYKDLSKVNR
ncbi:MAG: helix-turn-helix transcriptional regulator [Saccharofermentans sp.]|nr:helix-turn-helix transcriptional regulator [Saccharofermentans sp.]